MKLVNCNGNQYFPKNLKKNMIYMYTNRVKCNGNNDFPKILRHAIYKCCDMQ